MINKKFLFGMILLFGIFSFSLVFAVGENTYCAERTISGAWCQDVPLEEVDQNYRSVPTSCEATSYCKLGTCADSQEGTCMENTPQKVCEEPQDGIGGGVWFDSEVDEIPQCQLGCCLIGNQAAFVTQTRCKQLSSVYGLETNYRTDIQSEVACISTATSEVKGACVFEKDFERTCRLTTRGECSLTQSSGNSTGFHEDFLCSAEQLATNCGPSEKTILVEGKDEVYFVDTCGNLANIYDANRQNDKTYWEKIVGKIESCGFGDSNAGSATCGNCDYFLGSTGKEYGRGDDPVSPKFGNYICRDLSCEYQGENYNHGETWCAVSSEDEENLPGSRYFRQVCYNGEVSTEACSDFRQEVCIQDELNGFKTAACRVNKWQDCISQTNSRDCTNTDRRDCQWLGEKCVPKFAPGFDFWQEGDAESLCLVGNNECIVKFESGIFDDEPECVENCECLGDGWAQEQNNLCIALGDCGAIQNYLGYQGYHSISELVTISEYTEEETGSSSSSGGSSLFP
tara:strand:+ start:9854 stop:11392 length:1539 start_codon:yes stop_codon:yes gene_type:complete